MSDTIIRVENISKQYRLGQVGRRTISHDVNRWWHKVRGKEDPYLKIGEENDRTSKGASDYVWALQDINFEVKQGEVLGIIGRNGAGKSTLLKILSKVTAPTKGDIKLRGRIASLLEVGTGFHPDLSGRDNIFLNGAILGMTRKEIQGKFDEIVDFAGVERYIDTPVKRYSSGMYVRLAFAVAAHLEPEILIVDEVLAVGDAEFQKKCLGKMKDVSVKDGRTVLFVSHQMGSISKLCNSAILLTNGKLKLQGTADYVIDQYLKVNKQSSSAYFFEGNVNQHDYYIKHLQMVDEKMETRDKFGTNESLFIKANVAITKPNPNVEIGLALLDRNSNRVFTIHESLHLTKETLTKQREIVVEIPSNFLAPGHYSWIAVIHIPHQISYHLVEGVCNFSVVDSGTQLADYEGSNMGIVLPKYNLTLR